MKLYICMVIAGSICTMLYIIFNCMLPYEFELSLKNIFLKLNIMFYILPIPWIIVQIKEILNRMLEEIGISFQAGWIPDIVYPNSIWEGIVIKYENNHSFLTGFQKWIPVFLVVSAIFFMLIFGWIITYLIIGNNYKKDIIYIDTTSYVKDMIKRKRRIQIGISPHICAPVTIGIFKPVILLPGENDKYTDSASGIIYHELQHILRMDGLFRFFSFVVVAMGWYNPLAYYLLREYIAVSEMLCDEAAVDGMSKEEKMSYMRCIIEAVRKTRESETIIMSLGKTKGLSKERMKRIMEKNEKKVWKRNFTVCIMVLCFWVSSIPALAYREPMIHSEISDLYGTEEDWSNIDKVIFTPNGVGEPDYTKSADFSHSDNVFINEGGESYSELYNQDHVRISCSHSYETGIYSKHFPYSDGSCKKINYDAQRCTKCGYIIIGLEVSTTTYKACPH